MESNDPWFRYIVNLALIAQSLMSTTVGLVSFLAEKNIVDADELLAYLQQHDREYAPEAKQWVTAALLKPDNPDADPATTTGPDPLPPGSPQLIDEVLRKIFEQRRPPGPHEDPPTK